ncbi:MAG: hypothetical protein IKI64_09305 [Clostridia bacterium]|nr:hypothetical protein [Clostridia bacterium]
MKKILNGGFVKLLHRARKYVFYLGGVIEFIISLFAVAGIVMHLISHEPFFEFFKVNGLLEFLRYLFDAMIGIEFIKLLCRNDLYSMIEVLMFAVTRHLVIQHLETWEILIGTLAIAVLFAIRKFLFLHKETYEQMQRRREYMD